MTRCGPNPGVARRPGSVRLHLVLRRLCCGIATTTGARSGPAVDEVVFQLPDGEWIRLFRANGFEILDLIEPRPAPDAVSSYRDDEDRAWARRRPAECIWRLRRAWPPG